MKKQIPKLLQLNLDNLRKLADLNGVAVNFYSWTGEQRQVSALSLLKVLHSMGVAVTEKSDDNKILEALKITEDAPWMRTLPPTTVVRQGNRRDLLVHVNDGESVRCWCVLENGTGIDLMQLDHPVPPRNVNGQMRGRATFEIPDTIPIGYHQVFAEVNEQEMVNANLYVVPQRINPSALSGNQRYWGVNAQTYSVSSNQGWGVGDAWDIADLVAVTAQEGADFLLINPVHASQTVTPIENSPYRPVSREWLNVTYIRPETILEYASLPLRKRKETQELRANVNDTQCCDQIRRNPSWEAKNRVLHWIFEQPRSIHREAEFKTFCSTGGINLERHATWSALTESLGTIDLPKRYDNPTSDATKEFANTHAHEIEYHKWLQWIATNQLEYPNNVAKKLGMTLGIMADLAVGTHPMGSDCWSTPETFAQRIHVGAPPDMYSQLGQNWTQPPWIPSKLEQTGYEPFKQMVRASLKLAGALRIDHILGLFRLWWVPDGHEATEGCYVHFDHEAMVGILLLEAHRHDAVLIGEDLGTVENWVRTYLNERGILGTSVFWFEKDQNTQMPLHADHYRQNVLGTVNTHDLPPTLGYLEGIQTKIRHELGLLVKPLAEMQAQDREEQKKAVARLHEYGLLDTLEPSNKQILVALHRYIARTPARLVAVALVDQVGERRPQNFPGTHNEYPNWRVPLGNGDGKRLWLEQLVSHKVGDCDVFAAMREELG